MTTNDRNGRVHELSGLTIGRGPLSALSGKPWSCIWTSAYPLRTVIRATAIWPQIFCYWAIEP